MTWSNKIENVIYHIFRMYDIKGEKKQQESLKIICINQLNVYPMIKEELKTDKQIEFFVMQMALENIKE